MAEERKIRMELSETSYQLIAAYLRNPASVPLVEGNARALLRALSELQMAQVVEAAPQELGLVEGDGDPERS